MLGIDIENISRFENKDRICNKKFLERIFTLSELDYCYSKKNYAAHLCARFCAKEAVIKALSYLGIKHSKFNDIEIFHGKYNEPHVRIINKTDKLKRLKISISLSHNKTNAVAVAMINE